MSKKKGDSATMGIVVIALILAAAAYFVLGPGGDSDYKSKLVPDKAPAQIHHPWLSGKKKKGDDD